MTDALRVRAYNVRFGDAILISVPDRGADGIVTKRHILIDYGNILMGEGGGDAVFEPIVNDILKVLDGTPLDLYVMTHEHMDHVQGLFYAERKFFTNSEDDLKKRLNTQFAWLTASSAPDYYEKHTNAKKKHLQVEQSFTAIENYLAAAPTATTNDARMLMLNNNPRKTADCVAYLQNLAEDTSYVSRGFDVAGHHAFEEATFNIWAPEEDTAEYYGTFNALTLGVSVPADDQQEPRLLEIAPPAGVDAGAFFDLISMRRQYFDNLLAIDKAANNTSIVFCLEWRGWRLLFTGDAEERSWHTMDRENMLKPVHFLKVSHHGSHNGTPQTEILEKVLPEIPQDDRERSALVSTFEGSYNNVPHQDTLNAIKERCKELVEVHNRSAFGGFVDLEFPAD